MELIKNKIFNYHLPVFFCFFMKISPALAQIDRCPSGECGRGDIPEIFIWIAGILILYGLLKKFSFFFSKNENDKWEAKKTFYILFKWVFFLLIIPVIIGKNFGTEFGAGVLLLLLIYFLFSEKVLFDNYTSNLIDNEENLIVKALKDRGYDPKDDSLRKTAREALHNFQRDNGLKIGPPDQETMKALEVDYLSRYRKSQNIQTSSLQNPKPLLTKKAVANPKTKKPKAESKATTKAKTTALKAKPTSKTKTVSPKAKAKPAEIAVIGMGGCGIASVENLRGNFIKGADWLSVDKPGESISQASNPNKLALELEAKDPAFKERLEAFCSGRKHLFFIVGLGGGFGSHLIQEIADGLRRGPEITFHLIAIMPFAFEGAARMGQAEEVLTRCSPTFDKVLVLKNQELFSVANKDTTFEEAFRFSDGKIAEYIEGFLETKT